ncbi:unnamed protein product [Toxocara canis]|uniref:Tenascin n=1 Tax=Toxocara canis TaxID=6265 RepID=A0A183VB01_TOXCA|nr:unnamed protein product [Toxocara canis]
MDCDSSQHLCKNGATCVNIRPDISTKRFKCICINGFDGDYCEHNVDDCADNLCELGSKCIDGIAKYTCDCPLGKIGVFCQLDDPCVLEPCKAGSECVVDTASGTYQCECQKGYTGRHCSEDINECELCPSEYKGRNCMQHVNLCEVNPCRFYGDLCEHKCVYGSRDAICIEYELNLKQIDSDVPQAIKQFCEDHKCETKIGNGVCDSECNHYECEFDGGDCSALTKPFSSCATPSFCARVFHDSKCDPACASEECLFDGFDCAARIERCPFEELCKAHYANGICDDICNTALCLYDGGDCADREHSKNSKVRVSLALHLI